MAKDIEYLDGQLVYEKEKGHPFPSRCCAECSYLHGYLYDCENYDLDIRIEVWLDRALLNCGIEYDLTELEGV